MTRWATVLPLAASVLVVTACGAGASGGTDGPGEAQVHRQAAGAAGIDPCRVLDAGALGTYGSFAEGRPSSAPGARSCSWSTTGSAPDAMTVVVAVREQRPLVSITGSGVHLDVLNGRHEALLGTGPDSCSASLAVGDKSTVDVTVRRAGHQGIAGSNDSACADADAIAGLAEPALPDAR